MSLKLKKKGGLETALGNAKNRADYSTFSKRAWKKRRYLGS